MILKDNSERLMPRSTMVGGLVLAVLATSTALIMAGLAGWQRGGTQTLSLIGASLAILVVLGAHLLPALHHAFTGGIKAVVLPVWMLCMTLAIYNHAGIFLYSQQHAGAQRATKVSLTHEITQPKRNVSSILAEQVQVKTTQDRIKAAMSKAVKEGRPETSTQLRVRLEGLNGRLTVLAAEEEEVRRLNSAQDALLVRQQRAAEDPVALAIWQSLGVPTGQTNLVVAIGGAAMLEMLACLGWVLLLTPRHTEADLSTLPAIEQVIPEVMEADAFTESLAISGEVTEFEPEVTRVMEAVSDGLMLRPTVEGVRKFLRCSSKRAREVTRLVKYRLEIPIASPSA